MQIIDRDIYRKAFNLYLRKGIAIETSLQELLKKQEHPTTHYIWRTRGDDKVRSSHSDNNGKIFAWDNPPETGNPGEDYGCRCVAEHYIAGETEYAYQEIIPLEIDIIPSWTLLDFVKHFYFGKGNPVRLQQIGHLQGLVDYYFYKIYRDNRNTYERLNSQIIEQARKIRNGKFSYNFNNSYT
jgi:SPP1 gp7 family putative phage head morphogenesis protein